MKNSSLKPTIAVLSQGCSGNFGDGEKIARAFSQEYEVEFEFPVVAPAAFYLNVCTVKGNAQALKLVRKANETFPEVPLFITGCAPKDFQKEALKISEKIIFTQLKNITKNSSDFYTRENHLIGIVNVEEGCLDACAFCSTHLVKGRLQSFPEEVIIEQVKHFVEDGCKEIQLAGQDTACYGFDRNTHLAALVKKILQQVQGDYHLRLGMGNPRHVLSYAENLLDVFEDERVYRFLHLPVQSGSDNVLKLMNRKHTAADFYALVELIQSRFSKFTLSTDLIVGFPGETEEDFQLTLNLLQRTKPVVCNITRFVARPGTVAALSQNQINDKVKHERSALLAEKFQQIACEKNAEWIGAHCEIVIEKEGYRKGTFIGRNSAYRPVALQGHFEIGERIPVRITGAEPFALIAEKIIP